MILPHQEEGGARDGNFEKYRIACRTKIFRGEMT
jgi:hypothetical protein